MDKNKPYVSFCILSYNQEKYIKDAIKSALYQTYENMEVIISDDCSSDRTVDIINEVCASYNGKKNVVINLNDCNMGIREHCNKLLYNIAKGDIILLAGGDDVSDSLRTEEYVQYFIRFPEIMSISCKSEEVNETLESISVNAEWDNSFSIFNINDYIEHKDFIIYSGDSRGLRREVIEKFPPLQYSRAEDMQLFIRSLLIGAGCYIRKPLVKRRNHDCNASKIRTKKYEDIKLQGYSDVSYAYEHGYISKLKRDAMYKKIDSIKEEMELYWNSPFSGFRPFFYRCLSRLWNVRK